MTTPIATEPAVVSTASPVTHKQTQSSSVNPAVAIVPTDSVYVPPIYRTSTLERRLLNVLLTQKQIIQNVIADVKVEWFTDERRRFVFENILRTWEESRSTVSKDVMIYFAEKKIDPDKQKAKLTEYVCEINQIYGETSTDTVEMLMDRLRESYTGACIKKTLQTVWDKLDEGHIEDCLKTFREAAETNTERKSKLTSVYDILDEHIDLDYVVQDKFVRGSTVHIQGASKSRKSFLTLQFCMCLASAKDFLGMQIPKKQTIIYYNMEIMEQILKIRLQKIAKSLQIPSEDLRNLHFKNCLQHTDIKDFGSEILSDIHRIGASVIVIDPIYLCFLRENEPEEIKGFLKVINDVRVKENCTCILVHHFSKGDSSQKTALDRGSGSGVLARQLDFLLTVQKHAAYDVADKDMQLYVVEEDSRQSVTAPKFTAKFDMDRQIFETDKTTEAVIYSQSNAKKKADVKILKEKMDIDKAFPAGEYVSKETFVRFCHDFGMTVNAAGEKLAEMMKSGKVLKVKERERGGRTFYTSSATQINSALFSGEAKAQPANASTVSYRAEDVISDTPTPPAQRTEKTDSIQAPF